jgi:hypothetical protein
MQIGSLTQKKSDACHEDTKAPKGHDSGLKMICQARQGGAGSAIPVIASCLGD